VLGALLVKGGGPCVGVRAAAGTLLLLLLLLLLVNAQQLLLLPPPPPHTQRWNLLIVLVMANDTILCLTRD